MQVGADGTQSGWLSDNGAALADMMNPHAVDWRTADFEPGDIVVLGKIMCHCSVGADHRVFSWD